MVISYEVIIENHKREILLQKQRDNRYWALIDDSMKNWREIYRINKKKSI